MKDKLDRFISNLNGQFVEVSDSTNKYQCMDLAYNWTFALDIPKATIQRLYAFEVYTKANDLTREYFDLIPNTPDAVPDAGDLVVWSNKLGTAGHIGIATGEGTTSKFKVFEQNNPLGTNAHVSDRPYSYVLGFLRPKNRITDTTIPIWLVTLLQERNLSLEREGEFRDFWGKAVKYDDEIKSLKDQLISTTEALSQRASELSMYVEKNQRLEADNDQLRKDFNTERDKYNKEAWECQQKELLLQKADEEIKDLQKKLNAIQSELPLTSYSWIERFVSLFKRR